MLDVEPLDEQQQRHLTALRKRVTIGSRRAAFAYGFVVGGAIVGGIALGVGVAAGASSPLLVLVTVLLAAICGVIGVLIGPYRILQFLARAQMPSKASLDTGVSSYQIDGGRAWKIGEEPPPKYWDSWKSHASTHRPECG